MLEAVRPLIAVMALSLTRFALCQTAPISTPAASPKPEPISLPYPLVVEPSGPLPIESSEPEYSEEGRRAGLEGTAFVQVDIAPDGTPLNPTLVAGIGLGLDEKALEAVRKWRFAAPTLPQFASAVVAVDFLLPSKVSRWHLVRAAFDLPEGSTRPVFLPNRIRWARASRIKPSTKVGSFPRFPVRPRSSCTSTSTPADAPRISRFSPLRPICGESKPRRSFKSGDSGPAKKRESP